MPGTACTVAELAEADGRCSSAQPRPDGLTLAAFAGLVVLVATNVIAVSYTNREIPPFWGAGTRFGAASALFFGHVIARRLPLPRGRALLGVLLFGILQFGVGFAFAYWALVGLPAGLASVFLALVPLFTILFASLLRLETLTWRGLLGALTAVAGIAVMFWEGADRDIPVGYFVAAVAMTVCFALAPVIVKAFPATNVATTNAVAMLTGSLVLLALSVIRGEGAIIPEDPMTWVAQVYLVLPGSVGVFALMLFALARWTASGISYLTVLSPIVAIGLSAWLLGEPLTSGLFLGTALVLAGVYVGALLHPRARGQTS
jgi:drug/metabolite transporter (DMT)-like permease